MKIQVVTATGEKKNYFINWQYTHKKRTVSTHCHIFENKEIIATGRTYVHKGDTFIKSFGRKVALAKAMACCIPDKNERKQIWDQYRIITNEVKVVPTVDSTVE